MLIRIILGKLMYVFAWNENYKKNKDTNFYNYDCII